MVVHHHNTFCISMYVRDVHSVLKEIIEDILYVMRSQNHHIYLFVVKQKQFNS